MTQTRDLIKKMADFFAGKEFYEKGEDARLELSPDDVRCMYCLSCALDKIRSEIEEKIEQEDFARSVFLGEEKDAVKAEQCMGSIRAYKNVIKLIDKHKAEGSEE